MTLSRLSVRCDPCVGGFRLELASSEKLSLRLVYFASGAGGFHVTGELRFHVDGDGFVSTIACPGPVLTCGVSELEVDGRPLAASRSPGPVALEQRSLVPANGVVTQD
jgi:hypothetical protein